MNLNKNSLNRLVILLNQVDYTGSFTNHSGKILHDSKATKPL